jgi:hypothetical protein
VIELYSVPIGGGEVTPLNIPLVSGGNVFDFAFSPDNNHVLYFSDQEVDEQFELFVTYDDQFPTATPTSTATHTPTVTGTVTETPTITPTGTLPTQTPTRPPSYLPAVLYSFTPTPEQPD